MADIQPYLNQNTHATLAISEGIHAISSTPSTLHTVASGACPYKTQERSDIFVHPSVRWTSTELIYLCFEGIGFYGARAKLDKPPVTVISGYVHLKADFNARNMFGFMKEKYKKQLLERGDFISHRQACMGLPPRLKTECTSASASKSYPAAPGRHRTTSLQIKEQGNASPSQKINLRLIGDS